MVHDKSPVVAHDNDGDPLVDVLDPLEGPDDRLRLLFTCCHPAIAEPARVALTLHTLGGLTTAEIARAFLVPEQTLAQRIVRAKTKISRAKIPYRVPPPDLLEQRIGSVLKVIYLIFNEGYSASSDKRLVRVDLCEEALQIAKLLDAARPNTPEVMGLITLILITHTHTPARLGAAGC